MFYLILITFGPAGVGGGGGGGESQLIFFIQI